VAVRKSFLALAALLAAALPHSVAAAATESSATVVSSSASPAAPGQAVTLTATVSGAGTPTGTVSFEDFIVQGSPAPIGSADLVNGQASVTVSLPVGVHFITARYGGDQTFFGSAGSLTQRWGPTVPARVGVFASPNPAPTGTPVTLNGFVFAAAGAAQATGTVTFSDGSTVLGSAPLGAPDFGVDGIVTSASLTTSTLAAGTHSITMSFPGDANLDAAASAPASVVIGQPVATSTFLSSFPNPSAPGQAVIFGINVSPQAPATPFPSGPVTLLEGAIVVGSGQVVSGSGSISVSTLAPGSHQIVASYGGDGSSFAPSTSQPVTQTVLGGGGAAPTNVFLSGPSQVTFGQTVTVTASVTSLAPGTPTGSIVFTTTGPVPGATVPLGPGATASFTFTPPSGGGFSIDAAYGGDATFAASTARLPLLLIVAPIATATTLSASVNPGGSGQPVTFTAHVTPATTASPPLSGEVTFLDGLEPLATVALDSSGAATLTIASLALGQHSVTAQYVGSLDYGASVSPPLVETIAKPATATAIASSVNPAATGEAVALSASVSAESGVPTGTVAFRDGATVLASVALSGGQATFTTAALGAGHHAIAAVYSGDASFQGSASDALDQVVLVQRVTSVTLTSSRNPSHAGQGVRFTATITSPVPAGTAPTGTVTFRDGAKVLGTAKVHADGTAHLEVSTLAAGSHGITARYEGDAAYAPHTSDALTQVVQAPNPCPPGPSGDLIRWPSMFAQACCVVLHIRSVIAA
jgi:hypothetical protein